MGPVYHSGRGSSTRGSVGLVQRRGRGPRVLQRRHVLDEPREQAMYELLRRELPETSVISVGHRSTLFAQHERELHLTGDGGWKLRPIEG